MLQALFSGLIINANSLNPREGCEMLQISSANAWASVWSKSP